MGKRAESSSSPPAQTGPQGEAVKSRVCVARIGAAHGTRGEVKLWPFTASAEAVGEYGPLETADGTRAFEIEALRPAKDFYVARLKGVTDRTAAERLCNTDLYVPRERLPAPEPDEFYHADLVGLDVLDTAGMVLGTVIAVHNFGAGDLLEIAPAGGGETVMLPFTAAIVPTVEIAAGRIIVDAPAGLLESETADTGTPRSSTGGEGTGG
jgi:16S rRNA processing protein RimM